MLSANLLRWIIMQTKAVCSVTYLSPYIMCLFIVIRYYLYCLYSAVCGKMGVGFPEGLHILRPRYSGRTKDKNVLMSFCLARLNCYLAHKARRVAGFRADGP